MTYRFHLYFVWFLWDSGTMPFHQIAGGPSYSSAELVTAVTEDRIRALVPIT
jgi:hypothetical protein